MASSRQLMAGRHLTAVTVTLLSIAADGTIADGTSFLLAQRSTLTGWIEDLQFETEYEVEDGTVLGSISANDIPHVFRHACTITEPLRYVATGNLCASAFYNAVANGDGTSGTPFARINIQRAGKTFRLYVLMRAYREEYRKNKCVGTLTCAAFDPQAAQALYS